MRFKLQISILLLLFQHHFAYSQISGCTDPLALNYNSAATLNDGSCIYPSVSISPTTSRPLDSCLMETSGLIEWDHDFWTHNDNSDTMIYRIDTATGSIDEKIILSNVINHDWEELSQDSFFLYLGDFGNNVSGNRTDLMILRISKSSILEGTPQIDTIAFSYSDQVSFSNSGTNNTNFDCEAFIVSTDSIYLFTKHWVDLATTVYSLPKVPGNYLAQRIDSFFINGLITGSTYLESRQLVVLSGYSKQLAPFLYLLYDFQPNRFFSGNKRKVDISLPFHQIEGVTTTDGIHVFCTNEYFKYSSIENAQKFHTFDLDTILGSYINTQIATPPTTSNLIVRIFPNPSSNLLNLEFSKNEIKRSYKIFNQLGAVVMQGTISEKSMTLNIHNLSKGSYFLKIDGEMPTYGKFIKL